MFHWKSHLDALHASYPGTKHKPVIGITGNFGDKGCELAEGYFESVLRAGATPVVLPPTEDADALVSMLDRIDGLLLSGGADLNPLYLGEEPSPALHSINPRRDLCELLLVRLAYNRQLPMLGICRGIQMLAAALDGKLWQDLGEREIPSDTSYVPLIKHSQDLDRAVPSHTVRTEEDSLL
nr:gamma-glutamyl-gamma-aminobutyrate hydrolase family protein [Prevotella sp.]